MSKENDTLAISASDGQIKLQSELDFIAAAIKKFHSLKKGVKP